MGGGRPAPRGPRGSEDAIAPETVAGMTRLAARLTAALDQAGGAAYHIGMLSAQAYTGAVQHGMPDMMALEIAEQVTAHLLHAALPLPSDGDEDSDEDGDALRWRAAR